MFVIVEALLFIVILMLPLGMREFRNSAHLLLVYWFVILLRQTVAFTNAFVFTTLGADADAVTFHQIGVEMAESGDFFFAIGGRFYENMLGVVYWLFGSSLLLGQQLSILAFAFSCIVLLKINRLLGLGHHGVMILMVYGALPTMVLLGSITMRESYQVLFFMLTVYFGIKMHIKGGVNTYLPVMMMSAIVMGLFHHALIVYAFFLVVLLMIWTFRATSHLLKVKTLRFVAVLAIPVLIVAVMVVSGMQLHGLDGLTALANMDLLKDAADFRDKAVPDARATYGIALDLSSPFTAIYTSILLFLHYLFAPFPWQVRGVLDLYATMESLMRMVLLYCAVKQWRISNGVQRRMIALMLILFFSMTFMWAMGTTNYGTAMRHHMLSWWILVIIGLPLLMRQLGRIRLKSAGTRRFSK